VNSKRNPFDFSILGEELGGEANVARETSIGEPVFDFIRSYGPRNVVETNDGPFSTTRGCTLERRVINEFADRAIVGGTRGTVRETTEERGA
jgi:hypothetical protein